MLRQFANWLSDTALSQTFQNQLWIIPVSQSIHILCVGIVLTSALMLSVRILGSRAVDRSVPVLTLTLLPWMCRAWLGLLLTGTVQFIAEPLRQVVAPVFWWKMLMVAVACLLTGLAGRSIKQCPQRWESAAARPAWSKAFAVSSLALWIGAIYCGRFIAYTWLFHV